MPQIHMWSDYVCPFCLIADEVIERAIEDRHDVEVIHHPFELRPFPTPTLRPEDPYLPAVWDRAVYPIARRHAVALTLPTISPQPRTELAFRGFYYASDRGQGARYHRRMLTAFFQDNLDIGDRRVLASLADELGMNVNQFTEALDDETTAERLHQALAEASRLQISVAPTLIIGQQRITGVADESRLRQALSQAEAA